jgi:membrane protease YdiL (CAAX protease family)
MVREPVQLTEPESRPPASGRRIRALVLVLVLAFGYPLLNSTGYFLFGSEGRGAQTYSAAGLSLFYIVGIAFELANVGLLIWILRSQGRSLRDIGLAPSWKDVPKSILLAVVSYSFLYLGMMVLFYGYYFTTGRVLDYEAKNIDALGLSLSPVLIVFIVINPFFEELIARAYLMTEVVSLSGSRVLAVIVSAGLQAAYHLYQGGPSAFAIFLMFLVFSLYFARSKRIFPVILAHLYFDLLALFQYARS